MPAAYAVTQSGPHTGRQTSSLLPLSSSFLDPLQAHALQGLLPSYASPTSRMCACEILEVDSRIFSADTRAWSARHAGFGRTRVACSRNCGVGVRDTMDRTLDRRCGTPAVCLTIQMARFSTHAHQRYSCCSGKTNTRQQQFNSKEQRNMLPS